MLEEVLHAAGNLAQHSTTCRRYFLKSGFPNQIWMVLGKYEQNETLVEQALCCLPGLLPVASDAQREVVSLQDHFFGQSYTATVSRLRSAPLLDDYLQFIAQMEPAQGKSSPGGLKLILQVASKHSGNPIVAEAASHFFVSAITVALVQAIPPAVATCITNDTCSVLSLGLRQNLQSNGNVWSLAALRWVSAFRVGLSTYFVDNDSNSGNTGEETESHISTFVFDEMCEAGAVITILQLLQAHALSNETVCLWTLSMLLQMLSHSAALGHLVSHPALCDTLTVIATHYSLTNPALVILSYSCCVQLCYDPAMRLRLLQVFAESGNVNFVLHSLAHSLGNTEVVRLAFETIAVTGLGPQHDALSFVCRHAALLVQQSLEQQQSEELPERGASWGDEGSGGVNTASGTAPAKRKFVPGTNILSLAQRLRKALVASNMLSGSSVAAYPMETQLGWEIQPLGALDSVLWTDAGGNSSGLTGGALASFYGSITNSGNVSGSGTASAHTAIANALVDPVSPLALIALVTFQQQGDLMTIISVINALHSLAIDASCRAKLLDQPDIFFTALRILKANLLGEKAFSSSTATEFPENAEEVKTEKEEVSDSQAAPTIALEPIHVISYKDTPVDKPLQPLQNAFVKDTATNAKYISQHTKRSLLCTLILHLTASSCLPFPESSGTSSNSGTKSQDFQQRRIIHISRLVNEMELLELLCFVLRHHSNDVCLCEAALRCLTLILTQNSVSQELQRRFTEISDVTPLAASEWENVPVALVAQCLRLSLQAEQSSIRLSYYAVLAIASLCQGNPRVTELVGKQEGCALLLKVFVKYGETSPEMCRACCQAVQALSALAGTLGRLGVCALVVQALTQQHSSRSDVTEWGCRALGSLAECDDNRGELDAHEAYRVVVQSLQRHVSGSSDLMSSLNIGLTLNNNSSASIASAVGSSTSNNVAQPSPAVYLTLSSAASVAQWGCVALYQLAICRDTDATQMQSFQQQLIACGACEAVARALLRFSETESVAQACCRALVVLLLRNPVAQQRLGGLGVCSAVVEALHLFPGSAEVAEWGSRSVAVLADAHEANISKLALAGACETIPVVLQSHPSSEAVAVAGCDAISFMSENQSGQGELAERFGQSGACEAVVSALKKHFAQSELLTARCSVALATLARVPGNARWFGPAGACEALSSALQKHWRDDRCAKHVVVAIGNLCAVEFNKERLGNLGVCDWVVKTARLHCQDTDAARACATAIWKLCETFTPAKLNSFNSSKFNSSNNSTNAAVTDTTTLSPVAPLISTQGEASTTGLSSNEGNEPQTVHEWLGLRNRARLLQSGACEALVECLTSNYHDLSTAIAVCRGVFVLCQGPGLLCDAERDLFYRLQTARLLLKTMQHHARAPQNEAVAPTPSNLTQRQTKVVLDDLSQPQFGMNYEDLARYGCLALGALCGASRKYHTGLHRGNQREVQRQLYSAHLIVHILRHYRHPILSSSHSLAIISGSSGLVGASVSPHYHLYIEEAALTAIRNICMLHPENQSLFGQARVCEALLEMLDVHGRNFDLVTLTTQALFSVTDGHDANRLTLCYSGAAELLSSSLQRFLNAAPVNTNNTTSGISATSSPANPINNDTSTSGSLASGGGSPALDVLVEHVVATMLGLALHPVGRSRLLSAGVPKQLLYQVLTPRMLSTSTIPFFSSTSSGSNSSATVQSQIALLSVSAVQLQHGQTQQALALWRNSEYIACLCCALLAALAYRQTAGAFDSSSSSGLSSTGSGGSAAGNTNSSLSHQAVRTLVPLLQRSCLMHLLVLQLQQQQQQQQQWLRLHSPFPVGDEFSDNHNSPSNQSNNSRAGNLTNFVESLSLDQILAPPNCSTTRFLHHRVDLVQETSRALFYLCLHSQAKSALHQLNTSLNNFFETSSSQQSQNSSTHDGSFHSGNNIATIPSPLLSESETKRLVVQLGGLDTLSSFLTLVPAASSSLPIHSRSSNNTSNNNSQHGHGSSSETTAVASLSDIDASGTGKDSTEATSKNQDSAEQGENIESEEFVGALDWAKRLLDLLLNNFSSVNVTVASNVNSSSSTHATRDESDSGTVSV